MILSVLTALTIAVVYYLAKQRKINLLGELVIGFFIGLCWELAFEPAFDYSTTIFSLFIYKDVPLAVVLGWALCLMIASLAVDYLSDLPEAVSIPLSAWGIGLMLEVLGVFTGMWTYTPVALPLSVVFGWLIVGSTFLWIARALDDYIELLKPA